MKKNGSPPPEFEFAEDHSYFLIRLLVHRKEKAIPRQEDVAPQVTPQVTTQATTQATTQVEDHSTLLTRLPGASE